MRDAQTESGRSVAGSPALLSLPKPKNQTIALETLVSTLLILPPTLPMANIAATAIRAPSRLRPAPVYSLCLEV
jgi:hypothetical protein